MTSVSNYKRLLYYVKPYWGKLFVAMACMGVLSAATVALAYLTKPMLDDVFIQRNVSMLKIIPLALMGVAIVKGLAEYTQAYLMAYVGLSVIKNLRDTIYAHLQTLSASFFTRTPTGLLISRITNDVNLIQRAVSDTITSVVKDFFTIIGLSCYVFFNDWRLAVLAFFVFPWAIIPIYKFGRKVRKFSTRSQEKMADISTHLHETITGHRIIKAFGMEEYENRRFSLQNNKHFRYFLKRMKARALSSPVMETIGILVSALFVLYGGYRVIDGYMTPGEFFSTMVALAMFYQPVKSLNKANLAIQEGLAGATRIFAILDTKPEIVDHREATEMPPIVSGIEFQDVSFKYEEDWVLRNINLTASVGDIVALVGPSGAGKTTLINLIPRFYDVSDGQIIIDEHDIRKITLHSLRTNIGLVTQQTILFNDTIRYNISYGHQEKTEEEVIAAAKAANAHGFIEKLPKGYDTIIGEQGVRMSGGEKQRLTIARAILKDPPILILDEATSSLDSESEKEVQKALANLMVNRTTFVIAHRLSTIKKATKIIALSDGLIVGVGSHEELLKESSVYKKLYETQFQAYQSQSSTPPVQEKNT
jgi:subfamily B ATP-binding cassette protein MsbA